MSDEEEPRECWCPCSCGCRDEAYAPCGRLLPSGLCSDCDRGNHEIPPEGARISRDALLKQFKSIVKYYEKVMAPYG